MTTERTTIVIAGGGPAGLLLSRLLMDAGVEHIVIESRSREEIFATQRAGILEQSAVNILTQIGLDRVVREGDRHGGIYVRFDGESHHVNFEELVGRSVYLYPQTEVFHDLAGSCTSLGSEIRWETEVLDVIDQDGRGPSVRIRSKDGIESTIDADLVVGADGSHSTVRRTFPETVRRTYTHEYPYAWFGIIVEAPRSADELVYCESAHGFALLSQRTDTHQRMYFQCDPEDSPDRWSDEQIWEEYRKRVAGTDGFEVKEGPITERAVLRFRSSVVTPIRRGRVVLVGDAAHTVPPTGAKGLNLAIGDVAVLHRLLLRWLDSRDDALLDEYGERSARRVWRAQHFSAWMSTMMHTVHDEPIFHRQRRLAELRTLMESEAGRTYLAEGYTGWGDIL